eukprot:TRINITY_DN34645_c0_g1_i1.p1 TRINITY_DN34645_c0_g1~~TRINITY_DN34645_c0_g1_i1.p1  ORF type:complete len:412 (+),score=108.64 TRINITY_DN34645_c0_g1_i1:40-1275(+)
MWVRRLAVPCKRQVGAKLLQRRYETDEVEEEDSGQRGIEEFVGQHIIEKGFGAATPDPGRSWMVEELEGKSYEDLRRIWFLCLKERNQLKSVELFYQHQTETFGDFPHPDRLNRVEVSLRRVKEVVSDRHTVATRVAWKEFMRRISENQYRFPAGPQPPAGYDNPTRRVAFYSKNRIVPTPEDYNEHDSEKWERLVERVSVMLEVKPVDVKEDLTPEGVERKERLEFVKTRLRMVSRDLLAYKEDLVEEWRREKAELKDEGPYMYTVTLPTAADCEEIVKQAENGLDEVVTLGLVEGSAPPPYSSFIDDEHVLVSSELLPLEPFKDDLYENVLAREEWLQRARTRPAPVRPQPFADAPSGVDPFVRQLRSAEHNVHQVYYEYSGSKKARYIDSPHEGTQIISRYNKPNEEP